jgi:subtilisin family serine protease
VQLIKVLDKATKYAHKRGVTIIASAGNDAINFDVTPDLIDLPAASANVLAISALGPVGYAYGATNFDRQASYTNFGRSLIEFGAPGGDGAYPGNEACTLAINPAPGSTSTAVTAPCWVFDLVVSDCRGSSDRNVCFAAGTSMAAPAASGVAALIIGKNGRMDPDDVEAQLRRSADDLGAPGRDAVYGFGRVNAFRAVQSRSYANNQ